MRHFLNIAHDVDCLPALHAIALNPDLWNENTLRTAHPGTAHSQVSDIWCWFNPIPDDVTAVIDDREVIPYRAWTVIPQLRPLVFDLMRRVEGTRLGRVIVTRLPPGKTITPHVDGGAPAEFFTRYQIMLHARPGVLFHCGDETLMAKTGDAFLFNNQQLHSVVNNSDDDRIVLICDIRVE